MISIVTPVLNGVRFLEECIESVRAQGIAGLEHLVVDGASTDGSVETLRRLSETHRQLRWISEPDAGQSEALNKGIRMAKGELLGVLNVDDYYEPGALARVARLAASLPEPCLLLANCRMLGDGGRLLGVNRPGPVTLIDLLVPENEDRVPINPSQYFYPARLHAAVGFYRLDDEYAMDLDFLLRALRVARVSYYDEVWGNFRFVAGTKTFEDQLAGRARERFLRLLGEHTARLPLYRRLEVGVRSWLRRRERR